MNANVAPTDGRIRAPKLAHVVADHLRLKIVSGELKLGDSLPSEGELLKQLGISRPTLREALRVLEYEGLIQLGRGARAGASVLSFSIETAAKYGALYLASQAATLGEINEVRMLLEPPLVSVLAGRAKNDLVRQLKESLKSQREALEADDYVGAVRAISDFHGRLVTFSQNRTLSLLVGMLSEILPDAYAKLLLNGSDATKRAVRRRTQKSSEAHAELVEIILRRQPSEAEIYWRGYMADTAAFLRKSKLYDTRVELPASRY
jgi:GntR family transcriptional repressor for pyruvate dehydrogenase complex